MLVVVLTPHKKRLERERVLSKPSPTTLPSQPTARQRRRAQSKSNLRMTLVGLRETTPSAQRIRSSRSSRATMAKSSRAKLTREKQRRIQQRERYPPPPLLAGSKFSAHPAIGRI